MPNRPQATGECSPFWCGGTADEPCATSVETEGQLHDDELDALEEQDRER